MKFSHFKLFLFLFTFNSFVGQEAQATPVTGTDLSWESLGNDKYRVTAHVYRDCNGVNLYNTAIKFGGSCTGISQTTQTMSSGTDITPVCPNQCTRCADRSCTFQYGVERYDLTTVIDVSSFKKNGCCEITISWTQCCRNGVLNGGQNENFYVDAKMNVCLNTPDNSPVFDHEPNIIMCLSRDHYASFAANDVDTNAKGEKIDSLVYSFTDPLNAASKLITWKSPYSTQKPLAYHGFPKDYSSDQFPYGIHLDSSTGSFKMRPTKLEQAIFAIKVEQYRAGKKTGEITRDYHVIVIKCPNNNSPVLSGFRCNTPIDKNFEITVCPEKEVCLDICATDKDAGDTVSLDWNNGIQGAQFKILNKGAKREEAKFCWTPEKKHLRSEPYIFSVTATDNTCPLRNKSTRIYKVYVKEAFDLKAEISQKGLCGNYEFSAYTTDSLNNREWNWYLNDTVLVNASNTSSMSNSCTHKVNENGTYSIKIQSIRSGCVVDVYDTIKPTFIRPIKLSSLSDTSLCESNRITRTFAATGGYGKLNSQWHIPFDSASDTNNAINAFLHKPKDVLGNSRQIFYQVTDSAKCSVHDSFGLWIKYHQSISIQQDTTFCGDLASKTLPIHPSPSNGTWRGTGVGFNRFSPISLAAGSYTLTYFSEDSSQCFSDTAIFKIATRTLINAGKDLRACPKMDRIIQLQGKPLGGVWSGAYVDNKGNYKPNQNTIGKQNAQYTYTNSDGCVSVDSLTINTLNYLPNIEAGNDTIGCINDSNLQLAGTPAGGSWSGNYVSQNSGFYFNGTKAKANELHVLKYTILDSIGCVNTDSITVSTKDAISITTQDESHCLAGPQDTVNLTAIPKGGNWSGKGLFGDSGELVLDSNFIGTNKYRYELVNLSGCISTKSIEVTVRENPHVFAGEDDTMCISSQNHYTFKSNVAGGTWAGSGVPTNASNYAFLSNKLNGANKYVYTYSDQHNCSSSDTLTIYVGNQNNAAFKPSKTTGIAALTVDFENISYNGDFYYWDFGNGLTSQAFEPSTTYTQKGEYEVTLLVVDSLGYCQTTAKDSITVDHNNATGKLNANVFRVYPNPTSSYLNIENESSETFTFAIFNSLGQQVLDCKVLNQKQIDVSDLSSGIYSYKVSYQGKSYLGKIIIE